MSQSTVNLFLNRATASPYAVGLGLGLSTISYFFWGNLACQSMGAISISINPSERKKLGIDTDKAVEMWSWGYKLGAKHFGIAGTISGLSVLFAAFQLPARNLYITRNYLYLLSAALLANGIYTVAIMLPTNNRILAIRDNLARRKPGSETSESRLTIAEAQEAEELFRKWKNMHYVRLVLGAVGWVGILAAYVTTV